MAKRIFFIVCYRWLFKTSTVKINSHLFIAELFSVFIYPVEKEGSGRILNSRRVYYRILSKALMRDWMQCLIIRDRFGNRSTETLTSVGN